VIKHCISGHELTKSQYTVLKNVELLGDPISQFDDQRGTHISAVEAQLANHNGIGYLAHWNLSTRFQFFEDFSEEWYYKGEI